MKIKKTKRLLALILCMALVLGTNTFTMAAGAGQTQEESLQEQENISQEEILQEPEESSPEEAGTESVQAQALEAEEIIEEEPQEEAQEQPQGEEIQKDSMGETEEAATEDDGQGETAETNGEENVTEETEDETAGDMTETTVPEDGTAENELGSENTAQDNDQGKDSQIAEAGEKQENGTTAGEVPDQEEIDEQETDNNIEWSKEAQSFTNTFENISVLLNAEAEVLPINAEIKIEPAVLGEEEVAAAFGDTFANKRIHNMGIVDVKMLWNGTETALQEGKTLELQFDISDKKENSELSVYYLHDSVTEKLEPTLSENGTIRVHISQFGTYAVFETEDAEEYNPPANYWNAGPLVDMEQLSKLTSVNLLKTKAQSASTDVPGGVYLNKTATYDEKMEKIKIQLESYITGSVQGEAKPIDIVLILDQSGSMDDAFSEISYTDLNVEVYNAVGDGVYTYRGKYDLLTYSLKHDSGGWYYKPFPGSKTYVTETSSGTITITKQGALIDILATAGGFIDLVADEAKENKVQYNLGAIYFYGSGYGGTGHGTYEITNGLVDIADHKDAIKNGIKNMRPNGGTYPEEAFEKAQDWFGNNTTNQEVAIFFTDGEPGDGNGVEWNIAGPTVNTAKNMKTSGVTIYSVGIFEGADAGNTTSNSNKFMHGVSSNYPNATYENYRGLQLGTRYTTESGEIPDYYLTAGDAEGLKNIFDSIAQEMQPSIDLGTNTVLKDTVTDQFEIPEGANELKCYTSDYLGNDEWGDKDVQTYSTKVENNTVTVSGFNFTENMVADEDLNGNPTGKKLIVEFYIEPTEDFIGGNAVTTNGTDSGIYENSWSQEPVGLFTPQKVNVPIQYNYESQDDSIYIGDTWNEVKNFFDDESKEGIQYKKDALEHTINGINNAYVDIEYTVKQGSVVVGIYKIDAGKTTGEWTRIPVIETSDLVSCTDYTVTVNVKSKFDPVQGEKKGSAENITDKEPSNEQPKLHVFVPKISVKDQKIFMGESVNLNNSVQYKGPHDWVDVGAHIMISSPDNESPALKFEFKNVSGTALGSGEDKYENYVPEEDSNFNLKVQREDTQTDITGSSKITNSEEMKCDDCYKPDDSDESHKFTIHVVAGEIQLKKAIKGTVATSTEGNPVFTFKITYTSESGDMEVTYHTVEFKDNNKEEPVIVADLKGLKKGTYIIEELDTQRYDSTTINCDGSTNVIVTPDASNKKVTVQIGMGEHKGKQIGVITYTNRKNEGGSLTDTDVVINRFTYSGSDEGYTFKQEEPTQAVTGTVIDKAADFISGIFH